MRAPCNCSYLGKLWSQLLSKLSLGGSPTPWVLPALIPNGSNRTLSEALVCRQHMPKVSQLTKLYLPGTGRIIRPSIPTTMLLRMILKLEESSWACMVSVFPCQLFTPCYCCSSGYAVKRNPNVILGSSPNWSITGIPFTGVAWRAMTTRSAGIAPQSPSIYSLSEFWKKEKTSLDGKTSLAELQRPRSLSVFFIRHNKNRRLEICYMHKKIGSPTHN